MPEPNWNIMNFNGRISIERDDACYVRTVNREAAIKFFKSMGIKNPKVTYEGPTKRGGLCVYKALWERGE